MILKNIRLHPFGGTADKTFVFSDTGITRVVGPNEFGKSTMARAVYAVLFIAADEYKKARKNPILAQSIPSNGDHAAATLSFHVDGIEYELHKTWSNTPQSILKYEQTVLTDAVRVEAEIARLVNFKEGTYAHIFFLTQATLSETVGRIFSAPGTKNQNNTIDSLQDILGSGIINYGGVSWQNFKKELTQIISNYNSRWDISNSLPDSNRDIDNPWLNNVGYILKAYYHFKTQKKDFESAKATEELIDGLNEKRIQIEPTYLESKGFCDQNRQIISDLQKRMQRELTADKWRRELKTFQSALLDWPQQIQDKQNTQKNITSIQEVIKDLQTEWQTAKQKESATQLKKDFEKITLAKQQLDEAKTVLNSILLIDDKDFTEAKSLSRSIAIETNKLIAQKLSLEIAAINTARVVITDPVNGNRDITLQAGQTNTISSIPGLFELETGDLHIKVSSEAGSAGEIADTIKKYEHGLSVILDKYALADYEILKQHYEKRNNHTAELNIKRTTYDTLLAGRTYEKVESEINHLNTLPQCRSTEVLNQLLLDNKSKLMQYENKQTDIQNKLNDYENQYQTTDNLLQLLTQKNMAILNEEAALKDLAQLPAGYASFDEFNNQYQSSQRKVEDLGSQLSSIKAKLEGLQMDKSTDELKQTMDEAELEWKRRLEEAKAYALIQQQIEARERNQQQDPFCEYKVKMQETFFKLTGNKYSQMEFSGLQPVSVSDQQKSISPDWLSQGTKDSLALTIRLTMADYYLKDRPGFLLLDDPMTNMDPDRKKLAQEQLDEFAQNRQVILLGCANSDNP